MKTIGIIGGMSWESTASYYLELNRYINRKLGGYYSAECIIRNVQYQDIKDVHKNGDWDHAGDILADAAWRLQEAGADFIILATNTMHIVAPRIKEAIQIPFLHIAEVMADRLKTDGIKTVGLLGTRFTMEQDFYKNILIGRGITVLIPDRESIEKIHTVINSELTLGRIDESSRRCFVSIIDQLNQQGAEGVILGCTEIGLLVSQNDTALPVYDTALLHADAAADYALSSDESMIFSS